MRRLYFACLAVGVFLLLSMAGLGQAQTAAPDSPTAAGTVAAASSQAVVPRLMKFTGMLRDAAGKPVSGAAEVTFALYAVESGGDPLWFETQSVTADEQGRYSVLLGVMHTNGLPMDLFTSGEARWLGVQVGNEAEQKPRVLLLSVPYALKAADAETLGGLPASAFLQSVSPGAAGTVAGAAQTTVGSGQQRLSPSTCSATPDGGALATQVALYTGTCTLGEDAKFVDVSGNIGIGTANPIKTLHVAFDATGATPTIIAATGATNTNRRLLLGYETSANYGVIQSNEASVGYTPLALNPNGGNVGIGMGTAQPKALLQAGAWTQIPSDIVFSGGGTALQGDFFIGNNTIPKTRVYSNGGATTFASNEYYNGTMDKPQNTSLPSWRMYMYFSGGTDYFAIQRSPASSALAYGDVLHITSAGNVGIGTTTPAATLEVNGTAKFDSAVTFAGGQTFPGAGTVTSVASGAGLTGGPITTSGTLSIATGGVTNSMLANPSLTINTGSGLTGGGQVYLGESLSLGMASNSCSPGNAVTALPGPSCQPFASFGSNYFNGSQTISVYSGTGLLVSELGNGQALQVMSSATPNNGFAAYFTNNAGGTILGLNDGSHDVLTVDTNGVDIRKSVGKFTNDPVNATVLYELVGINQSTGNAKLAGPGYSGGFGAAGIAVADAGTSSNYPETIAVTSGETQCVFDNTAVNFDFFQVSPTTAGLCHDAGPNWPPVGQVLGIVIDKTQSPPGVFLFAPGTGVETGIIATNANCSSSASPAVCASAGAGSVAIAASATSVVVDTTAVTANSQIMLQEDSSLGTKLSVTCNTTAGRSYMVTARTAATSFTITSSSAPSTNPACLSYVIIN